MPLLNTPLGPVEAIPFPGRIIRVGDSDKETVKIDFGEGLGHSGIVIEVANGRLVTIEGNTNDNGSRNGIGVFQRDARKISKINKGFIDYSAF